MGSHASEGTKSGLSESSIEAQSAGSAGSVIGLTVTPMNPLLTRGSSLTVDPRWLHYGEIVLTGTFGASLSDFQQALHLISTGEVDVRPVISHRISLDGLLDAVQKVRNHDLLKVIVLI